MSLRLYKRWKKKNILKRCKPYLHQKKREEIVNIVRNWGDLASDAVLDPDAKIFQLPGIEGMIAYQIKSKCAVVYGNPLSPPPHRMKLIEAFEAYIENQNLQVIYISATRWFADLMINRQKHVAIEFGYELTLNPQVDPRSYTGTRGSLVRRKVRHAQKEGVSIEEYTENDPELELAISKAATEWLQQRKGLQLHISHPYLFDNRHGKRWFYAKTEKGVVGVVVLNALQERQGWLLNHLMFTPNAPNGTPEYLIVEALATVAKEGCEFISLGNASAEELQMIGFSKIPSWIAKKTFKMIRYFFHLDGHMKFFEKFHPQSEPSYLLFKGKGISLTQIFALMQGLNLSFKSWKSSKKSHEKQPST